MAGLSYIVVSPAKVVDYLLNLDHVEGRSKAKFFLARGFSRDRPVELADALAAQAIRGWPGDSVAAPGATKHRVVGPVDCPDGSAPEVLTVWQVLTDSEVATLVTARPHRRKAG